MSYEEYKQRVVAFYRRHGRMPGYRELMEMTGYRSKNAVFKLIGKLVDEGVLKKDARGRLSPGKFGGARVLGVVEAGFPSPAEEELLDVMDFDEYLTPNKESSYILKVKGDSMIDAGIQPGDMVIVERRATYKPGQIVVASVDGEFTMKYLRQKNGAYFLEPANEKYKPIYPSEEFRVEAVVTAVVRKY
ncbi:LexA family transcriptional repressor [Candidatus Kaiserbacteria bacterium CG10_big_fil_rev_8_21_14_0_10_59_10]|uniref:LexA family transcriptional repressor n=1 Tax=Candidatus Kaiserbacteria bacterium CG10_big_fil_rev_8_21_14_0_10_59_10 TaxID=1974612 RepID=A0A2H0U7W8_9BACT|nr:MAG: LexA family transcriptional repressor [Candidatus Kaiserbacteria bacterium CG10_big_fil_rev_8_21_14_0_10_59_10]